eukprot:14940707-Alexandrium_andersonii.AAC.1
MQKCRAGHTRPRHTTMTHGELVQHVRRTCSTSTHDARQCTKLATWPWWQHHALRASGRGGARSDCSAATPTSGHGEQAP